MAPHRPGIRHYIPPEARTSLGRSVSPCGTPPQCGGVRGISGVSMLAKRYGGPRDGQCRVQVEAAKAVRRRASPSAGKHQHLHDPVPPVPVNLQSWITASCLGAERCWSPTKCPGWTFFIAVQRTGSADGQERDRSLAADRAACLINEYAQTAQSQPALRAHRPAQIRLATIGPWKAMANRRRPVRIRHQLCAATSVVGMCSELMATGICGVPYEERRPLRCVSCCRWVRRRNFEGHGEQTCG
jgi:hypothetical protein